MINKIIWNQLNSTEKQKFLLRPAQTQNDELLEKVADIIRQVREGGDTSLKYFTKEYDQVEIDNIKVSSDEIDQAVGKVGSAEQAAIQRAIEQIQTFHQQQLPGEINVTTSVGIQCRQYSRPIDRVGLYVPGGSAPLVSTVLMLAIPAQIAGCNNIAIATPPEKDGRVNPYVLYAANQCGIKTIYKIGGAQAIAALAYGTESVMKVDKIFGPGNAWVTAAKQWVANDPLGAAIDLPAGPSEVLVIADESADPSFVAADLLSQAEHGVDSQVLLLTDSTNLAESVTKALAQQLENLPRSVIASKALANSSIIVINSLVEAITITNDYAPEHLIINTLVPELIAEKINNAASIFVGAWTPEALGDYASGTNHVLPTYGYAKAISGLSVSDFMKKITWQRATKEGLKDIAETVVNLAKIENLAAHANAIKVRLEKLA